MSTRWSLDSRELRALRPCDAPARRGRFMRPRLLPSLEPCTARNPPQQERVIVRSLWGWSDHLQWMWIKLDICSGRAQQKLAVRRVGSVNELRGGTIIGIRRQVGRDLERVHAPGGMAPTAQADQPAVDIAHVQRCIGSNGDANTPQT